MTEVAPLTERLAKSVLAARGAPLDAAVLTTAKQCLLDWTAVALAGIREPVAAILRKEFPGRGHGGATVIGAGRLFRSRDAALLNGATSHALDYDDVHPLVGHPSVAILPAALAVGEEEGASGKDVLAAFAAGYDAACFVGAVVMPSHYDRGFHSTATVGSFGAAVAAGLLLKLDETAMRMALGLAGTQAAGLKSMFGTMAKPFHAGRAAANGVLAARLARAGFTAHPDVIETDQGFAATTATFDRARAGAAEFRTGRVTETLFKYHAACYLTHSSIEAIRRLREQHKLSPAAVEEIALHVPRGHLKVCNIESPRTGLELKFSIAALASGALLGMNTAAIDSYSDEAAQDAGLQALRERVRVTGDHAPGTGADVTIRMKDGAVHALSFDTGIPDPDLARQQENLSRKFHSLADPVLGRDRATALAQAIGTLEHAAGLGPMTRLWPGARA